MVDVVLSVFRLLVAFFLVFMNGLFVATEFALVKIRRTRVNELVEAGKPGSSFVEEAVNNLDDYLAVCQLGITLSSLGLGWIGEPAVAALIEPMLGSFVPEGTIHFVAFALGFGFITFLHVVFGELAPKTFAIQEAEQIALLVSPPMKLFYYAFLPGILVFNGTANFFTRLAGVSPASESEEAHTEDELMMVLAQSEEHGHIDVEEVEMIEGVFELGDTIAREIMVPRPDIATVSATMPLDELRSVAAEGNFTRYLVLDEDNGDQPIGFVHVKDVLRAIEDNGSEAEKPTASDLARKALFVPENRRIDDILTAFRQRESQMAVVIDEWGEVEGIVTIEDILEEIVGEIRDEFDTDELEPSITELDIDTYSVDGHAPLKEVNEAVGAEFESENFETIGGLVLGELGRAAEVGDTVEQDGFILRVDTVEKRRISKVTVQAAGRRERETTAERSGEE
ncbi:hemolysin family protein [Haladaptatus caseinilyticus]|uniref:hemolysin family protein n=1 Tax=Haladaptatus caseinilyticus TaxID=2993314 RepID=UPI00224AC74A|nr:hemolysin family protein [Haladaptatus caseinilyticus]